MAVFDNIKDTLNKGVAAVSVKSETLVESSRVKSAISAAQKRKDADIAVLGAKLYAAWKQGEVTLPAFAEEFQAIEQIDQEIAGHEERLIQIKAEEAKVLGAKETAKTTPAFCTQCGKPLSPDAKFCTECGAPVK